MHQQVKGQLLTNVLYALFISTGQRSVVLGYQYTWFRENLFLKIPKLVEIGKSFLTNFTYIVIMGTTENWNTFVLVHWNYCKLENFCGFFFIYLSGMSYVALTALITLWTHLIASAKVAIFCEKHHFKIPIYFYYFQIIGYKWIISKQNIHKSLFLRLVNLAN